MLVRETSVLLGSVDAKALVRNPADNLIKIEETFALKEHLDEISSTIACHNSVRASRRLKGNEMKRYCARWSAFTTRSSAITIVQHISKQNSRTSNGCSGALKPNQYGGHAGLYGLKSSDVS